jgi:hypothetical protein
VVDNEQPMEPRPAEPGPAAADERPGSAKPSPWPRRRRRAWAVASHRSTGWVVAAALAGAVVALSVVLATQSTVGPVAFRAVSVLPQRVVGPVGRQVIIGPRSAMAPPGAMSGLPSWISPGPGQVIVGPPAVQVPAGSYSIGPGQYIVGPIGQYIYGPAGQSVVGPVFMGPGQYPFGQGQVTIRQPIVKITGGCNGKVISAPAGVRIYCGPAPKSASGK